MSCLLKIQDLSVSYGSCQVLKGVSFSLEEGQWLMLAGPNGAGKSTIVNAISQGTAYEGQIWYQDRDIKSYRSQELAQKIGVLAQNHYVGYSFTVREVVNLGRYAYSSGLFGKPDQKAGEQIRQALEMTGLTELEDHSVLELSGGELQRVFLAQLFAQDPKILILDEPTNHLDLLYQKQIFSLISEWIRQPGRAVISVVHDLSLAKAYATQALLLNKGEAVAWGDPDDVFSPEILKEAYAIDVYAWMRKMLSQWEK